ncbi:glycoside hydrolase family 28 protein [Bifidobacterium avesanii]|uniref:Rhamnogalacturonase A/B/Epimerase-like pectate lyase domain-containing protein n=1 Tax=Bifidobacterium avesanii TaxID=1798157 RepID=A0A7K3THG9_9BIFI|nr:glycoside hydrolase family 28 protein [Bifidobacterium avesanii]KAB8292670.1 endopygalactorunase [Bifidobacterium avesanii]NEG78502.1 hypothetical protein [Bifidobacterium avesanii]
MSSYCNPKDFGAKGDGETLDTAALQAAIDVAGEAHCGVEVPAGNYVTGSLFLRSDMEFKLAEGATLVGSLDDADYPIVDTRVAGVEMPWPAGVLNAIGCSNVTISGPGGVDGRGEQWWRRYWDMREQYVKRDLRWAVDYDCRRPRNVLVYDCERVTVDGISSRRSAFWNLHVCYSQDVTVRNVTVTGNPPHVSPSTDGIDIDSCRRVLVEGCHVDCNDDNICIKSGRDADGLRVNRPCEDVEIRNCAILRGEGVTIGSETSGGMRNIRIHDVSFDGTNAGFRIKSATTRGGVIEDVTVENLRMRNVVNPIQWGLNWNPAYSYCAVPRDWDGDIPDHWLTLAESVPRSKGMPLVRGLRVRDVDAVWDGGSAGYDAGNREVLDPCAFVVEGLKESPIRDVEFENISIQSPRFGSIANVERLMMRNVNVEVTGAQTV